MRTLIAALALAGTLALTACTAGGENGASSSPEPTGTSATEAPTSATPTALTPVVPDPLTEESATAESVRLADAIQALVPADVVVHVDDHTKLVDPGSGAARSFDVIRAITTTAKTDVKATATDMVASLVASGWISRDSTTEKGTTLTALVSGTDPATSWFVLVGADDTDATAPVVSIQLASPSFP